MKKHDLNYEKIEVPFLIINSGADCSYVNGDKNIMDYFHQALTAQGFTCKETAFT